MFACLKDPEADAHVLKDILEDPAADFSQHGKLKDEGGFYSGFFKGAKSYFLQYPVGADGGGGKDAAAAAGEVRRMRSVPRRLQQLLPQAAFGQDCTTNTLVVRSTCLRPSAGFEMTILEESRSLSHCLNMKRQATVIAAAHFFA